MNNKNEKKELKDYSLDELKSLYSNLNCYVITEHFIHLRKYDKKTRELDRIKYFYINNDIDIQTIKHDETKWDSLGAIAYFLSLKSLYTQTKNDANNPELKEKDKFVESINYTAIGMCYDILEFFCNPINLENENLKYHNGESYNNTWLMLEDQTPYPATQTERDEWFERYEAGEFACFIDKLHANDDFNIENGIATFEDVYYFVWNTLQYCTLDELNKLKTYSAKQWKIKPANRPSFNKKIHKYDKLGNYICTYENRQECIKKDNIFKSKLSEVLSGKRYHYKGYHYVEEK